MTFAFGSGNGFFQIALRGSDATLKLRGTELSLDSGGSAPAQASAAASSGAGSAPSSKRAKANCKPLPGGGVQTPLGVLSKGDDVEIMWVDAPNVKDRKTFYRAQVGVNLSTVGHSPTSRTIIE